VAQRVQRWMEVTPSQFTHEAEGLSLIRAGLPANAPFRAWSNFEFRVDPGDARMDDIHRYLPA
jgi:hypothetical protein